MQEKANAGEVENAKLAQAVQVDEGPRQHGGRMSPISLQPIARNALKSRGTWLVSVFMGISATASTGSSFSSKVSEMVISVSPRTPDNLRRISASEITTSLSRLKRTRVGIARIYGGPQFRRVLSRPAATDKRPTRRISGPDSGDS